MFISIIILTYIIDDVFISHLSSYLLAKDIATVLQKNNIVGARAFEDNSTWLSISIGTVQEMQKVVAAFKAG